MSKYLMIPIRLDALYVENEKTVVGQMADFSMLPFFNGTADFNPDTANISESIVSTPFQNENLRLGPGLHLHWALPDALTQGKDTDQGIVFPAVPNRWLVTRSRKNSSQQWKVERQWIVESDYLYPEGVDKQGVSVSVPYKLKETCTHQTYRYLGRKMPLEAWQNGSSGSTYLSPLTAVGYGNPHFAAFYPNCHSVFGLHDPIAEKVNNFNQLRYEVIGWYGDRNQDELARFSATLTNNFKDSIKEHFQWEMDLDQKPEATLCYARLDFAPSSSINNSDQAATDTTITVANSGTESLSAHLSQKIDKDYRSYIENQLEAFQVNHQLEQNQVDTIARLREIRNEKEFHSSESGLLWDISHQSHTPPSAEQQGDTATPIDLLPDSVAATLNAANDLQKTYDQAQHEIESQRKRLFADWYKYMLCCYPSDRLENAYPDIDLVKTFIEKKDLQPLQAKVAQLGTFTLEKNELTEQIIGANTSTASTLAAQLTAKVNQLLAEMRNGLVLDLRCDQVIDGKTPDSATNRNGTLHGNTTLVSDEKFGSCLSFDGSGDYVQIADNDAIDFAREVDFTLQAWVQPDAVQADTGNGDNDIFEKWSNSGGYPYVVRYLNSGNNQGKIMAARYNGSNSVSIISTKTLNDGQFHSLAFLKNGTTLKLFVDGEEQGSTTDLTSGSTQNSSSLYIGCRGGNDNFFKGKIAHLRLYNRALSEDELKKTQSPSVPSYSLKQITGPRYWQPNDPVVLVNGDAVKPTPRHGQDGTLRCTLYSTSSNSLSQNDFAGVLAEMDRLPTNAKSWAFANWQQQPWNPYLLEWQVRFFPTRSKSNLHLRTGQYDPAFITENYEARFNNPDLSVKDDKIPVVNNAANTYTNRSILTPYTKDYLSESLEGFLEQKILEDYFTDQSISSADQEQYLQKAGGNIDSVTQWYEGKDNFSSKTREEKAKDGIYTALKAYKELQSLNCLSQALGGFNEALLMHHQTLELPINDPLAFDDYRPFTQNEVAQSIGSSRKIAPSPLNDFNPIRSGRLRVTHLRLVDTFGQVKDLPIEAIATTVKMTVPESKNLVYLPPRLSQPARINFRWLAAEEQLAEMNAHSQTHPICGWLVPNYFGRSIMIYDAQGKPLGAVNPNAHWETPPGQKYSDIVEAIENPHLRKMAAYLSNTGRSNANFLNNFINALESALDNCEPATTQENQSTALMMGRPIALVRAALNIELQGLAAVNHDWSVLRSDMNAHRREHDNFTQVKFPVRLGEYRQLNDGLIGYWIENQEGSYGEKFYAPQADTNDSANIDAYLDRNPINFYQNIDEKPQIFSILVDVQGVVHATAGILPSKAISIPPDQYKQALQDIEVTFLTAPILSERDKVNLPLSPQQGYDWHWISKKDDAFWDEALSTQPILNRITFLEQSSNDDPNSLWEYLLQNQWLKAIDAQRASIVPKDQRSIAELGDPYSGSDEEIERIFDVCSEYIHPASTEPVFGGKNQLREGWIKLSKTEPNN